MNEQANAIFCICDEVVFSVLSRLVASRLILTKHLLVSASRQAQPSLASPRKYASALL
jgi:hypothetical protein